MNILSIIAKKRDKKVLTKEEIEQIEESHNSSPEKRLAQKTLAREVITFLHGEEELQEAIKLTECLFTGNVKELTDEEIEMVFKGMPTIETKEDTIINIMTNKNLIIYYKIVNFAKRIYIIIVF